METHNTPLVARRLLKKKKYSIRQAINVKMFSNIAVPCFNTWKGFAKGQPEKNLNKARKKLEKFATFVLENKKWIQRRDPLSVIGSWLQRLGTDWVEKKVPSTLSVDLSKCTRCFFCIQHCPTNNISFEDESFIFHENCTCCLRCYNLCPKDAILFGPKSKDNKKFLRYKPFDKDFIKFLNEIKSDKKKLNKEIKFMRPRSW
ncbi:MAG: EFR1 family ferrodoxin [Candidatus Helarchaeales archaeon]